MIDYLVVGLGIAGISTVRSIEKAGKSFKVVDAVHENSSSRVAGGLYNPIIFRRNLKTWRADELFPFAHTFYQELGLLLDITLQHPTILNKVFYSNEEVNDWQAKSADVKYHDYLTENVDYSTDNGNINNPHGLGEVKNGGWVDLKLTVEKMRLHLQAEDLLLDERFDFDALQIGPDFVKYRGVTYCNIVFCEGMGVRQNPYFNWIPLNPAKGELITIEAPTLHWKQILNKNGFLLPLSEGVYRIGATYDWRNLNDVTTAEARQELVEKLEKFIHAPYTITHQSAGVRPAAKDRKPIVGAHPNYAHMYVANGMGSKGVTLAPFFCDELIQFIENKKALTPEVDVQRFYKYYE